MENQNTSIRTMGVLLRPFKALQDTDICPTGFWIMASNLCFPIQADLTKMDVTSVCIKILKLVAVNLLLIISEVRTDE